MDLLTDRTLALEDVDSRFSRLLTGHAEATHDWAARFDIVENIIAARLASAPPPPAGLLHSWRILQESPNHVDLARLPEEFGCSRRHLIAQFHNISAWLPKRSPGSAASIWLSQRSIAWGGEILYRMRRENRISIVRRTALFAPPPKRRCGGRIWRSTAATTTSPISSTSSGLSPD